MTLKHRLQLVGKSATDGTGTITASLSKSMETTGRQRASSETLDQRTNYIERVDDTHSHGCRSVSKTR